MAFSSRLLQVANLACSISNNEEGVKLVRMAATQIDSLCPQVTSPPRVHLRPSLTPPSQYITTVRHAGFSGGGVLYMGVGLDWVVIDGVQGEGLTNIYKA